MERDLADALESLHLDAFGWALHCCGGDHSRAEDVLQGAYQKVAQDQVRRNGASSLKTWWFGVIRHTAYEEFRRMRYRESLIGRLLLHMAGDPFDPRPSPSRQMAVKERNEELRLALSQLPPRQAEALHLVFYQDLSLSEAAVVMKVTLGSARQHYERGKARLRSLLECTEPAPMNL